MPKIQFSDVTPPEKRSIRNVPIPNKRRTQVNPIQPTREQFSSQVDQHPLQSAQPSKVEEAISQISQNKEKEAYEYYYPKKEETEKASSKPKSKSWIYGTVIFAAIAVFVVGMMTVFSSATVNITPKSQSLMVDTSVTAAKNPEGGAVRYEVIKLSKSQTVSVPASGEEAAELKAHGKIVIYNNFSTEPQRLIIRTRFESPDGLIYRIPESVTIPGKTVKDGVETPGSIEVEVFADEAGEKYNIKKSDFTVPGFKNEADRYKTIYARSSTNMTGGFIGKMKTVLPEDKQSAMKTIDQEAESSLKKDLESKVPAGMALLPGAIVYKSSELSPQEEGSSVTLGKEVTAYAILLNSEDLSKSITSEYISESPEWNGIAPIIKDFSLLSVKNTPADLESADKIELGLNGEAKVWAQIDTEAINQKLLGAPKAKAADLITEYAGISSISAAIRPVWKQSFPGNPSKIYVNTNTAE